MKKILFTCFIIACLSHMAEAKEPNRKNEKKETERVRPAWYFRGGLGYAMTDNGEYFGLYGVPTSGSVTYINNGSTLSSYKYDKVSFDKGVNATIAGGIMFNRHVGIDLGINIGLAPHQYTFTANGWDIDNNVVNSVIKTRAKSPLFIMPSLVMQTGSMPVNLYIRAGLVIPMNTKLTFDEQDSYVSNGIGIVQEYVSQVSNRFSLGYSAAIGVSYKLRGNTNIWAELSHVSLTADAKQSDLKSVTQNGVSIPLSNYNTTVTYTNSGGVNDNDPSSEPFSSIGMNIGVSFRIK